MTDKVAKAHGNNPIFPGGQLNPKDNSLNLIRLVLAALVIVSHSYPIGNFGDEPGFDGLPLGRWAVIGFFVVSGYLITGSRNSRRFPEYLKLRLTRIYPAYLVNLVATVLLFAPIAHFVAKGTLAGYLVTEVTPGNYVFGNMFLRIGTYTIGDTLANVPYPNAWNGSLWTLYLEFLCYIFIGVLLCFSLVRKYQTQAIGLCFVASIALQWSIGKFATVSMNLEVISLLSELLPFFLGGAFFYQIKSKVRLHLPGFLGAVIGTLALVLVLPKIGAYISAPLIAYAIFWVSTVLPSPQTIKVNDISYGLYVYGFLVQQMLAVFGVYELGLPAFAIVSILGTIPFATASWVLVERPAMRRAKGEKAYMSWFSRRLQKPASESKQFKQDNGNQSQGS